MNNYFITDDKRQSFLKGKGLGGNQFASDFYAAGFDAADTSGKNYIQDFWANNAGAEEDEAFFTGLGEAQNKGWDDWFESTRGESNLNEFDFNFDGTLDNFNDSTKFFDEANSGALFNYNMDSSDVIKNYAENNSANPVFEDVTKNIKTTRPATQEDVDAGLATNIGDAIEELNIPSRSDALTAGYGEVISDAYDELKLKEKINEENLNSLVSLSDDLKNKQLSGLNDQYQSISDVLRGDTLSAMRAGMSGTNNATNRLLVDANMGAARDRSNISKQITDAADQREFQYGIASANALKKMRNDFADIIGATPEETDAITQLAKEYVEIQIQQGKLDVQAWEEYWQANFEVLEAIANSDNPDVVIARVQSQLAGYQQQMQQQELDYRNVLDTKYQSIDEMVSAILALNSDDPNLRKLTSKLSELQDVMNSAQSTLSNSTNTQTSDKPVVPQYDSASSELLLSQLTEMGNQTNNPGIIAQIGDLVEDFSALGDLFSDGPEDSDGDGTPDTTDEFPLDASRQ